MRPLFLLLRFQRVEQNTLYDKTFELNHLPALLRK
jgi:hypothetical protein